MTDNKLHIFNDIEMNYTQSNIYYHSFTLSLYLYLDFYFFLSVGIDFGGFIMKYSSKSFITYDTERSYFLESLSRNSFISSDVRKLKDTFFTSFMVVQCNALCVCISNRKIVTYTTHCSTVQCNTFRKTICQD